MKSKKYRIGQDKGECKFGCLPAILAMLFGESKYSTLLSAFLYGYILLLNLLTEHKLKGNISEKSRKAKQKRVSKNKEENRIAK